MKPINYKKLILPNIPYVFIALFATKVGQAVRLAPGSDFSGKALHIMEGLVLAFESSMPSFHPINLCVGILIALTIRLAVYIKGKNAKKFRKDMEYGSARWGTQADIAPYVDPVFANNIILTQTESLTMNNRPYGRIEFRKTTNTGNHLGGWTFRVKDSNYDVVGEYTTDENGYACTENLPLGRYTVIELQTEDNYWNCELGFHDVTVKAGETTVDEWLNREQGLGWFYKKTNTGESVEGWHITVYADEACTQKLHTGITNEEGRTGYYMDPGIYWAKETGDEYGRFEDEYWMVDETVQKFEIKPHEDTEITFTNVQYGKVKIIKVMEGEGSVAGWQFKITDAEGKEIQDSPFTSDENGEILTKLLPGTYTIEELIPKDSLYHCTSENPQTVTITQGEVAEVTFTNALRPGKITLDKVDIKGNSLAGATFLLEWSEDGSLWWPIDYSETFKEGCCSNPNVVDGCLTTGADGKLEWDNLHPGLQYRLTETAAPRGYSKLRKPAFEGELPEEDFSLEVKVINSRTFTLPETGSKSLLLSSISLSVCLLGLIASMLYLRKKEQ